MVPTIASIWHLTTLIHSHLATTLNELAYIHPLKQYIIKRVLLQDTTFDKIVWEALYYVFDSTENWQGNRLILQIHTPQVASVGTKKYKIDNRTVELGCQPLQIDNIADLKLHHIFGIAQIQAC